MDRALKEEMRPVLKEIGKREGIEDFCNRIADDSVATTEEEVLEYLTKINHPALKMDPMF